MAPHKQHDQRDDELEPRDKQRVRKFVLGGGKDELVEEDNGEGDYKIEEDHGANDVDGVTFWGLPRIHGRGEEGLGIFVFLQVGHGGGGSGGKRGRRGSKKGPDDLGPKEGHHYYAHVQTQVTIVATQFSSTQPGPGLETKEMSELYISLLASRWFNSVIRSFWLACSFPVGYSPFVLAYFVAQYAIRRCQQLKDVDLPPVSCPFQHSKSTFCEKLIQSSLMVAR
ncbi:hypothetical protein BC938DRAFT_478475 [Jimgerdemannia flammicorona]|uniref:Uncharacterized protein n=1 Tax=Jimgerdemannia flammicorona TaxID=994334 RepID=A0A433R0I7_9FUNG|nr:hypothetical protein BC938DRAFT_478475 [Jimgerdemannia flammicorona]